MFFGSHNFNYTFLISRFPVKCVEKTEHRVSRRCIWALITAFYLAVLLRTLYHSILNLRVIRTHLFGDRSSLRCRCFVKTVASSILFIFLYLAHRKINLFQNIFIVSLNLIII